MKLAKKKKRVLTGYRPTGRLHLGHWHGNLMNMLELQQKYDECFFFVADWHALTTGYEDTKELSEYTREMILDWVAVGLDPEKSHIYRQSDLPAVSELTLYLSMITPLGWLERCPTYKEQLQQLESKDINTFGFLGYPVLQAADILIMHSDFVPVGEDQLPHLELTREIARRFNFLYGEYFPEPQAILSKVKRLPGTDGRKMSKSYGNAIYLTDLPEEIREKVRQMVTDPERIYMKDPGHPEVCTVFAFHGVYSAGQLKEIEGKCRHSRWGCTDCKLDLAERIVASLADFQKRRAELAKKPRFAEEVLIEGAERVQPIAQATLAEVRKRVHID